MMIKGIGVSSPRFYDKSGNAVFTVTAKNGNERKPTIADARKNGWLPSVTTILDLLRKPMLENWKVQQGILSALTLPREDGESDESFAERIAKDSQEEGKEAASLGNEIHKAIEDGLSGKDYPPIYSKHVGSVLDWVKGAGAVGMELEPSCIGAGYAGRADLTYINPFGGRVWVDYKTQNVKNNKPIFYDEWGMQLAAYAATRIEAYCLISIVIDRTTGEIFTKSWDNPEEEFKKFSLLKDYYRLSKGLLL